MITGLEKQKKTSILPYKADSFCDIFESIKIQTNSICTRKCDFCYYGNKANMDFSSDLLSSDAVYKIIDELKSLNFKGRISFFEINEPLTDPRIYDFISYADKHLPGAWQMLITNGDLLDLKKISLLFKSGLNKIYISLYDLKSKDRIIKIRDDNTAVFKNIELMDLTNEKFIDNRGGHLKNYDKAEKINKFLKLPCERIYKVMYIRPNGNAVSCSSDFYEDNILGNVYEQEIKDIWFGEKYKKFRNELDSGNRSFSPLCSKCNYKGGGGYFTK